MVYLSNIYQAANRYNQSMGLAVDLGSGHVFGIPMTDVHSTMQKHKAQDILFSFSNGINMTPVIEAKTTIPQSGHAARKE